MATKNQNQVSEIEQFVKDHISSVPRLWKNRFDSLTIEEKVEHIKRWEQNQKNIAESRERQKVEYKVRGLFELKKPSPEEAMNVIEFCKSYINSCKANEIARLDEEIQKLTEMKSKLENN